MNINSGKLSGNNDLHNNIIDNTIHEQYTYENSPYKKREKRTTLPNLTRLPTGKNKNEINSNSNVLNIMKSAENNIYSHNNPISANNVSKFNVNGNSYFNSPVRVHSELNSIMSSNKSNYKNTFMSPEQTKSTNKVSLSPIIALKNNMSPNINNYNNDKNNKNNMFFSNEDKPKLKFKIKLSYKSKAGLNGGQPKTNQDSCLCKTSGLKQEGFNLYAVMDGHGSHGHFISNSVKTLFTDYVFKKSHYDYNVSLSGINNKLHEKEYEIFKKCFQYCETTLAKSKYEVNFSGTTAVMVVQVDDVLICANTGDSRAVLCTIDGIKPLSLDHKPDVESEKERIISNGGRVDKFNDNGEFIGPYRVWLKYEDYPGLAMSRSLGDFVSKSVGCTCLPQIIETKLDYKSMFLVIASDGVWEFLDNDAVCKLIEPYYKKNDPDGACQKVIEESARMWKLVRYIN